MACRLKALNDILKKKISETKFNEMCDIFDKEMGITEGTSRIYFYIGDGMRNIFSFILKMIDNVDTIYIPPSETSLDDMYDKVKINKMIKHMIVFDLGHAWSLNKKNDLWYKKKKIYKFFGKPVGKNNNLTSCGFVLVYSK
jgi:hypothetical protein